MAPAKKTSGEKEKEVIKRIHKRNGEIVIYDKEKIVSAITKAMSITGEGSAEEARDVAHNVHNELLRIAKNLNILCLTLKEFRIL